MSKNSKLKIRWLKILAILLVITGLVFTPFLSRTVSAAGCPDLKVVFVRGSGAERENNADYQAFKKSLDGWLLNTGLNYEITDLDYKAVGVSNPITLIGAYIGSGNAYEFGESVQGGVKELVRYTNTYCPNSKIVMAGYSQGALVIMKALPKLNQDKIVYLATFGDPKIYLPEGEGVMPAACKGQNLSDYRIYVPDCYVYEGLMGSVRPYEPAGMEGRVGTWCNKFDIFCSTHFSIVDHTSYESSGLYEDAAKLIYTKVTTAFNLERKITPHDTAILIDSTGSMSRLINKYKSEALRLAEETLASGGRVALYDYRDLADGYEPVEHCNFETCTLEKFTTELDSIQTGGGGDNFESTLSASLKTMKALNWRLGSTKSLVVLTDDGFLNPDRDGVTYFEVVKLSKEIDPVNFYIITESGKVSLYEELAADTDGAVVSIDSSEYLTLTDQILARADSLPKVEEEYIEGATGLPTLTITSVEQEDEVIKVSFATDGTQTLVILNDAVLGVVLGNEVTISGITEPVELSLVPLSGNIRGRRTTLTLTPPASEVLPEGFGFLDFGAQKLENRLVPKTPNTGRR